MQRTLIVMVKQSRAGRAKTRLGHEIGMTTAAWWYRHQTRRLLRRLSDPRWQLVLAVTPDKAFDPVWPPHIPRIPQGRGSLGQRMANALRQCPPGPACLIGSDIPDISRAHIVRAFDALAGREAVFGPAEDGGYWLIGYRNSRHVPRNPFPNVRWSTQHALSDSMAALRGRRIGVTDRLRDIDRAADLAPPPAFPDDADPGA